MSQPPPSGQQPPSGQEPGQPATPGQPVPQQPVPQQPSPRQQYAQQQYAGQPAWAPPPPRQPTGWAGTLGLTAVLLAITLGGYAFAGSEGAGAGEFGGEVTIGEPVPVAGGVTIRLAEGWSIIEPLGNPPGILLRGPGGNGLAAVPAGTGPPQALLDFYVAEVLGREAEQLSVGEPRAAELPSGTALLQAYVGVFTDVSTPLEGEIIAIVSPSGVGVVVDGWAAEGTYLAIREQVITMAQTVVTG